MAHEFKKRTKLFEEVVKLHPAMRAVTDSFIVSNPGKTTRSVNFTTVWRIPLKIKTRTSFREKWLSQPQKGIWVSWCHNLMVEFFRLLWRNVNRVPQNSSNQRSFGERKYYCFRMHCSEWLDLRIRFRQHIFAFFILGFMNELFKPCERL